MTAGLAQSVERSTLSQLTIERLWVLVFKIRDSLTSTYVYVVDPHVRLLPSFLVFYPVNRFAYQDRGSATRKVEGTSLRLFVILKGACQDLGFRALVDDWHEEGATA